MLETTQMTRPLVTHGAPPRVLLFIACLAGIVSAGLPGRAEAGDDLNLLPDRNPNTLLHTYLLQQARIHFDARRRAVTAAVASPRALAARQKRLRQDYISLLGHMPEKTPLKPTITGTIACDGYRIEKLTYQSRPNHHVTANLYLPTTSKGPFPGVLVPCGHSNIGKACEAYQAVCILLARNGFVTLIVDPISQGERYQFLRPDGRPATRGGTTDHTLLDVGAKLLGSGVVAYEAWDNIRGLDYLASRPEVDPERIGCTGNSGGGTQTTFLMAIDDRITVAAPSCYIMTREKLFATIGAPDGCQHLPNEVSLGIEHADYITMRAPKPTLVLAARQDFFDIGATRTAFAEAKRVYTTLGHADRVGMFEFDDKHGFSTPRRQAAVRWMRRWLYGDNTPVVEPEFTLRKPDALRVTPTGQVHSHWKDDLTVADLNARRAKQLAPARTAFWKDNAAPTCLAEVRRLIALAPRRPKTAVKKTNTIARADYAIDKLIIRHDRGIPLPALLFTPKNTSGRRAATLYIDGGGKNRPSAPGGPISKLVAAGRIVLAVDLRGFGETADDPRKNASKHFNIEHRNAVTAIQLGRPLLGQRVDDALAALDLLLDLPNVDPKAVNLVAVGQAGPVGIHAAALDTRFAAVTVQRSITTWLDVIAAPLGRNHLTHVVPAALTRYDLTDLIRAVAPRPVHVVSPIDGLGKPKR